MKTNLVFLVLLISILTSCGSGQLKTTDVAMDEAIIVGRAFINSGGQLIQKSGTSYGMKGSGAKMLFG